MKKCLSITLLVTALSLDAVAAITPLPFVAPAMVNDRQEFQIPDCVQLTGWLGTRIAANESNRLAKIDTGRLLEGYRQRPGRQSWDGEHVGKWLHAATLAWVNTGDPGLRAKLDETAAELCTWQLEDGYLGTYTKDKRWTEWDVWAHKYNLIGLLTYIRYTGNLAPLPTCERMGDLLCKTFGDASAQQDIIKAGYHVGMAPTSVLEAMVLLHRFTGEKRYLDFCNYILRAWEQPNGPHIVSRLLNHQGVNKVGNGKAYEMLSCLNGVLELYRTTGDTNLFHACLNAWQDIVDHRLYITGAASYEEVFHGDFDLPNNQNVGETCVTVTWLQFNAQLLRLTGEARFAEQLEHVALNQLLGAQQPNGAAWGYYVQMEGKKPYSATLDGHCCLSSGPRGIALLPTFAVSTDGDGAVVNLYDAGTAHLTLRDGAPVTLQIETRYPADGRIRITVEPKTDMEFSLKLRVPAWCEHYSLKPSGAKLGADGYTALRRTWKAGDVVELDLHLVPRIVVGDHLNQGKVAVCYGPLVLAADEALLSATNQSLNTLALPNADLAALAVAPEAAPAERRTWPGAKIFRVNATTRRGGESFKASLIPFADAGATGARYKIWLPLAGQPSDNVLLNGVERPSRPGNLTGSIADGDLTSCQTNVPDAFKPVPPKQMQQVYEEIKTPFTHGIVIRGEPNQFVDCPSIFRQSDEWYMMYVGITRQVGYETFLARSADLLHWEKLGEIMSLRTNGWDGWQADGGIALCDPTWGGSSKLQSFDGKYWMSYIGGAKPGYEPDPLAVGIAWTKSPTKARGWTRCAENPVLSRDQSDVREFEKQTLYKGQIIWDKAKTLGHPFLMFYNGKCLKNGFERIGMAVSEDMIRRAYICHADLCNRDFSGFRRAGESRGGGAAAD